MSDIESVSHNSETTYDYLSEENTPVVKSTIEDDVVDTENEPNGDEDVSDEEHKPWKSKTKGETPKWAKERFKEYSTTVRDLKDQNMQLMETVKQILNSNKPTVEKLTKADFPDEDAYLDHLAEEKVKAKLTEYQQSNQEQERKRAEAESINRITQQHILNAQADLPDYMETVQSGDPDVTLPNNVIDHLNVSPAGAYVKYRIAQDEALSNSIKYASPQEKIRIVAELHDGILDYLINRNNNAPASTPAAQSQVTTPTAAPTAPNTRKAPPKAPPKQKSGSRRDISTLSGDDYVRARNEQMFK